MSMPKIDDMDKTAQLLTHGYCTGYHCRGKGIAQEGHTCPYSEEINGNDTDLCTCCDICEHQCAMDI